MRDLGGRKEGQRKRGAGLGVGQDGQDEQRVRKQSRSQQKVPRVRKTRGFQDPKWMTLAEISNEGEKEPVEITYRG